MGGGFDPFQFAQQLGGLRVSEPAPVDRWNPPFCGDIDLVIKTDGLWYYAGTPIGRPKLVQLFASVLKREGEQYFLVTPVEKVRVQVEDVPFMIIAVACQQATGSQTFCLETSLGDRFSLDADHPLRMGGSADSPVPYVMVRGGMEGRLSRPVYYELANYAECEVTDRGEVYTLLSAGERFELSGGAL